MPDNPISKKPIKKQYLVGAGIVTGVVVLLWYRRRAAAQQSINPIGSSANLPGTMPGGAGSSTTDLGNTGTGGIGSAPTNLQDWMAKVQLWANSLGFDAATTQNALQAYSIGSCIPGNGYNILNQALAVFGMPPQAPYQGLVQCQPFQPPAGGGGSDGGSGGGSGGGTGEAFTPLLRLINVHTGDHFWTESANEVASLVNSGNWRVEGPAASVASAASATAAPFLRLISTTGEHFYTASPTEAQSLQATGNWKVEGPAGYIDTVQGAGEVPLLRLINPANGQHFWTTSNNEVQSLASQGWKVEGVAGYANGPAA